MSGIDLYGDPEEEIREVEQRDRELEREAEPRQERGHGERAGVTEVPEPAATDDEGSEDNDGGPPSARA
jgi:hypothetical protein